MSGASYRVVKWVATVGLTAAVLVLGCDIAQVIKWQGGRDVTLTVEAPQPVWSVSYACWWSREADHNRALFAEHGVETVRWIESQPKPAEQSPDGTFDILVRTGGEESGLRLLRDSYHQQRDALILVELETGEQWVAILTLPDVTKTTRATVRIPDDARLLPPAPAGERGGK
jgi:hypothetical protein